jgi:hypothetical protein
MSSTTVRYDLSIMEAVASHTIYSSFTPSVELTVHASMSGTIVRYDLQ